MFKMIIVIIWWNHLNLIRSLYTAGIYQYTVAFIEMVPMVTITKQLSHWILVISYSVLFLSEHLDMFSVMRFQLVKDNTTGGNHQPVAKVSIILFVTIMVCGFMYLCFQFSLQINNKSFKSNKSVTYSSTRAGQFLYVPICTRPRLKIQNWKAISFWEWKGMTCLILHLESVTWSIDFCHLTLWFVCHLSLKRYFSPEQGKNKQTAWIDT